MFNTTFLITENKFYNDIWNEIKNYFDLNLEDSIL